MAALLAKKLKKGAKELADNDIDLSEMTREFAKRSQDFMAGNEVDSSFDFITDIMERDGVMLSKLSDGKLAKMSAMISGHAKNFMGDLGISPKSPKS